MKHAVFLLALAGILLLQGCVAPQPNPAFRSCANACSKHEDNCMVNATTAREIDRCNASQDACVATCDKKYPRYLQH
ncbi:MAG TPA: hypothetical protein VKC56_12760 [Gallionellaceae bacterium]|nr:hypothetical protein [Gallionellaceae bacterium]